MKRKIVIGLTVYSFVFLIAGLYVVNTIRTATADLDRLITLHQVEILREHYLLQIKKVQSDLTLKDTPYSRSFGLVEVVAVVAVPHEDVFAFGMLDSELQRRPQLLGDLLASIGGPIVGNQDLSDKVVFLE